MKAVLPIFLLIFAITLSGCVGQSTGSSVLPQIAKPSFSIQDAGSKVNDFLAAFNVNLKFNIVNDGDATATDTRVNIEVIDSKDGRIAAQDTFVIGTLSQDQARLIEKTYNVWRGSYTIRIQVSSAEGVTESTQFNVG